MDCGFYEFMHFLKQEFPEILKMVDDMGVYDGTKKICDLVGFDHTLLSDFYIGDMIEMGLLRDHMRKYKHLYYLWIL